MLILSYKLALVLRFVEWYYNCEFCVFRMKKFTLED